MPSQETKTLSACIPLLLAGAVLSLFISSPALSHRANVFAYLEGDKIIVEGYFGGKTKAAKSVVEIFGSDGTKLIEGKTDVNGVYSFAIAEITGNKGDLKIVLHAGDGHKADYTLRLANLPALSAKETPPLQTGEGSAKTRKEPAMPSAENLAATDPALLKNVVEEALDARLEPIIRTLAQQQKILIQQQDKGPTLSEIFGGIGWIVGLAGIAAYFMSRKRVR